MVLICHLSCVLKFLRVCFLARAQNGSAYRCEPQNPTAVSTRKRQLKTLHVFPSLPQSANRNYLKTIFFRIVKLFAVRFKLIWRRLSLVEVWHDGSLQEPKCSYWLDSKLTSCCLDIVSEVYSSPVIGSYELTSAMPNMNNIHLFTAKYTKNCGKEDCIKILWDSERKLSRGLRLRVMEQRMRKNGTKCSFRQ